MALSIALPVRAPIERVFAEYTRDCAFTRSRVVVKLFEQGVDLVSRSQARRLLAGLDRFEEALLDFKGVEGIGQGFADEIFRAWAASRARVRLIPVNMNAAVAFMVRRAAAVDARQPADGGAG